MRTQLCTCLLAALLGAPVIQAAETLGPGDATWNIRLVELWGRNEKDQQRNMDIYATFKGGQWTHAIAAARRFNTSTHFIDAADVTLNGLNVSGKLKITIGPDRWVPADGQPVNATVDFKGALKPGGEPKSPFALTGTYKAMVGGKKVTGRLEGSAEPTQSGFEHGRWSVALNPVRAPDEPGGPMLVVTLGITSNRAGWGHIGPAWRGSPNRLHRFDVGRFKPGRQGIITGKAVVPARAIDVTADPKAVSEIDLTLIRVQGLTGGRATITTKLGEKVIDGPRQAFGRGEANDDRTGPPNALWRYNVDTAPWWTPVKDFAPVKPGEHPRMLFRKAALPALRAKAKTDEGKAVVARLRTLLGKNGEALPATFNDTAPATFNDTPPDNDMKGPKLPLGAFTTWHGAGYGMLYQLTGEAKYAELSRKAVELAFAGKIDRDNRYSWIKPGTSLRAGSVLAGVALAYDLSYDAWPADFRKRVVREIQTYAKVAVSGETITLAHLAGRNGCPPSTNDYGAYLGAGAAVLAILGDEGADTATLTRRLGEYEKMLVQVLCQGFGDHGWYAEGPHAGRVSANCGMQEFIAALRTAAGRDYVTARPNAQWLTLRWIMEVVPDEKGRPRFPSRGVYGGEDFDGTGQSHSGEIAYGFGAIEAKYRPALLWVYRNFIHKQRPNYGANMYPHRGVNAFVNWPAGVKPQNPAAVMPKAVADTIHGYFVCRNRWKDADDVVITHALGIGPEGYHRVEDYGKVRVWGLGARANWNTDFRRALPTFHEAGADGSMVLSAVREGKVSALAVDFSAASGAAAVLVGVGPAFDRTSLSGGGDVAKTVTVKMGGYTYAVVTLAKGPAPKVAVTGTGIKVGARTFRFDGGRFHVGDGK